MKKLRFAGFVLTLALAASAAAGDKITVCHKGNEISISMNALQAHLDHGDLLFSCEQPPPPCLTESFCS